MLIKFFQNFFCPLLPILCERQRTNYFRHCKFSEKINLAASSACFSVIILQCVLPSSLRPSRAMPIPTLSSISHRLISRTECLKQPTTNNRKTNMLLKILIFILPFLLLKVIYIIIQIIISVNKKELSTETLDKNFYSVIIYNVTAIYSDEPLPASAGGFYLTNSI